MAGKDDDQHPAKPSGRVRHDKGGHAIWEWAIDSGRDALDSTSRLLKKLDVSSLRLMGDDEQGWDKKPRKDDPDQGVTHQGSPQAKTPPQAAPRDPAANKGQSFNPYDSRTPARPAAASPKPKPPAAKAPASKPAAKSAANKRGLFSRLFGRDR